MFDYQTYDFSELPTTADGIAEFLKEKGIKGKTANPAACPISRYLTQNVSRPEDYTEWMVCAGAATSAYRYDSTIRLTMHPEEVAEFIRKFDHYEYPDLIG